jgi:acyl-coenzyme A thioesterase 13
VVPDWHSCFEGLLDTAKVVSFSEGAIEVEMLVERRHTNFHGVLHGGTSMAIVDTIGTMALWTIDKEADQVSTDISTSFCGTAEQGDMLTIKAAVKKKGRRMLFIDVDIFNKDSGRLVATGKHTKMFL